MLVTRRVGSLLTKLPADINPTNLEELRRVKQALVELENQADALRWVCGGGGGGWEYHLGGHGMLEEHADPLYHLTHLAAAATGCPPDPPDSPGPRTHPTIWPTLHT